jgi:dipeptidase E
MRLLLISSSLVHGHGYLDHPEPEIRRILGARKRVGFVPFALSNHEAYTERVRERLGRLGAEVFPIAVPADLSKAEVIFVGGGNTWRLLKTTWERGLMQPIRDSVRAGTPYIGSSAGTNLAMPAIKTTNDMPIVEPPSWECLGLVPYQINPHYLDPEPASTHMGETREERIQQFLEENDVAVVGLREGTMLSVENDSTTLLGIRSARIFRRGHEPVELERGTVIDEYVR